MATPIATAPTADSVAAMARQHATHNVASNRQSNDRSYEAEWKNFMNWVNMMRENNDVPPGTKYLTRENVDLYFQTEVVARIIQPTGARRIVSSLQRMANDIEYIDGSDLLWLRATLSRLLLKCTPESIKFGCKTRSRTRTQTCPRT